MTEELRRMLQQHNAGRTAAASMIESLRSRAGSAPDAGLVAHLMAVCVNEQGYLLGFAQVVAEALAASTWAAPASNGTATGQQGPKNGREGP